MAQISSFGAFPNPNFHVTPSGTKAGSSGSAAKSTTPAAATDETEASPLQPQLTRLSAVLNSLQQGSNNSRAQFVQALNKVKSGTYNVDSLDVSRSIVNDLLNNGS